MYLAIQLHLLCNYQMPLLSLLTIELVTNYPMSLLSFPTIELVTLWQLPNLPNLYWLPIA